MYYSEVKPKVVLINDLPSLQDVNDNANFLVSFNQKSYKLQLKDLLTYITYSVEKTCLSHVSKYVDIFTLLSAKILDVDKQLRDIAMLQKKSTSEILGRHKNNIAELSNSLKRSTETIANLNDTFNANINNSNIKNEQLDSLIKHNDAKFHNTELNIQALSANFNSLRINNSELSSNTDLLLKKFAKNLEQKTIKQQLKNNTSKIDELNNNFSSLSSHISEKIDSYKNDIASLTLMLNNISSALSSLDTEIYGIKINEIDLLGNELQLTLKAGIVDILEKMSKKNQISSDENN